MQNNKTFLTMKNKLVLFIYFLTILGFSQNPKTIIQDYINKKRSTLKIGVEESEKWRIESETPSESMNLVNYVVAQTYNDIKIDNSFIYFHIKNNKVINEPEGFISNTASKINTSLPTLNVTEAFGKAQIEINENFMPSIIKSEKNKYKLSNGLLLNDPVNAELVYFPSENGNLILSWSFEFFSQKLNHLWKIKVDATNGKILHKVDLTSNCSFENDCNPNAEKGVIINLFKNESKKIPFTPGTTNYRVIPSNFESPNHSPRQLITNPEASTPLAPLSFAASPNGWHNTNTTIGGTNTDLQFNYTRGNNVSAYSDFENLNPLTPISYTYASMGNYPNLTFDYDYPGNVGNASAYIEAATTNLFYMTNIMHDVWYQYGFDEASRNFQITNYGRGGEENDSVNAESQDASVGTSAGFNNANFSTPPDGNKPKMQMYIWNRKKPSKLLVNNGSLVGTTYEIIENIFSLGRVDLPVTPSSLTNDLVLYDDGTASGALGCTAAINTGALNGKIAVIRRGSCTFSVKVKNAQNAGAIGVIVVNNVVGTTISMTGSDSTITIPAVAISQADGEALITSMLSNTVNVSLSAVEITVNRDGDFDNGIIAHEYGHGISRRLVGGGLGIDSPEQPGEGWSDWLGLMMQIKPSDTRNDAKGIGTFPLNQPINGDGIRQYKYSTDMTVNPHTFGNTNTQFFTNASGNDQVNVHGLGSIWCVMLWDLAWNYIDKYGYDPNLYNGTGGNNKVMRLVIDAMKLTPVNPSLIQCRNAIIQADLNATNGANYCMIWSTFARRGMGINASSGNNSGVNDVKDQVEDFTEPTIGNTPETGSNCLLSNSYYQNRDLFKIYPNPSNGILTISVHNYSDDLSIKLLDLNGREVYSKNYSDFNFEKSIDISSLNKGIYILNLSGSDLNYTQKLILK